MEDAADCRAYGLGVVGVDAVTDEHDALRSGGIGTPDDRAGIAGIADVGADDQERRTAGQQRVERGVGDPAPRHDALGLDGVGDRLDDVVGHDVPRHAGRSGRVDQIGVLRRAGLGREDLDRRVGLGERLAYGLGALGEELAGLGPERTSGEPPGVLHTS